eukprot:3457556-Rhodomonas_salina.1
MQSRTCALSVLLFSLQLHCGSAAISSKTLTHWYPFEPGSFWLDFSGNANILTSSESPDETIGACAVGRGCATLANSGLAGNSPSHQYLTLPDIDFGSYGSTGLSISA